MSYDLSKQLQVSVYGHQYIHHPIFHPILMTLDHSWIIQCAQCARAHKAPPHWRLHHQANMKIVVLKFDIEL